MGVFLAHSPCLCCKQVFAYNPFRVPSSSAITGTREPVCKTCLKIINAKRIARGDKPFEILPGAYEPADESEWPGC